ncbi:MAG: Uma2 family endonuclease [Myxococcota bacterium]
MSEAPKRATYQDLLQTPEHQIAEIINGRVQVSPRPAKPHAAAASALGEELGPPFKRGRGGPGGWIILWEPELHLGDHVLVPDLAGWRRERMPVLTNDEPFFSVAPDWICEVVSPSTERSDRSEKLPIYGSFDVSHAWIVNPLHQTLEIFEWASRTQWLLLNVFSGNARVRAKPFDAIELDLGTLWADVELGDPNQK